MENKKKKVIIHRKEATKTVLKNIYDVANKIAKRLNSEGIDVSECFYTAKEWEKVKKDDSYKFI